MLDSDVLIMDDPYKYFKQPPFKELTVMNQAESPVDPNGGVLYVQNAAPEGPAAFMFAGKLRFALWDICTITLSSACKLYCLPLL